MEKAKEHKCSSGAFYYAKRLGYFEKIERGKYKCLVGNFEPIHARKVLKVFADKQRSKEKSAKREIKKKKKELSLFWGTIKIKW